MSIWEVTERGQVQIGGAIRVDGEFELLRARSAPRIAVAPFAAWKCDPLGKAQLAAAARG